MKERTNTVGALKPDEEASWSMQGRSKVEIMGNHQCSGIEQSSGCDEIKSRQQMPGEVKSLPREE